MFNTTSVNYAVIYGNRLMFFYFVGRACVSPAPMTKSTRSWNKFVRTLEGADINRRRDLRERALI